ncbi:protein DpdG [Solirubrobacter soli]|uniref:protein DpdG n=1 Tax=Solirubrobacter soli TaxID=363832 RepID=UPI0012FC22C1|nr:protein DpdG [Solirubrobacter soli]
MAFNQTGRLPAAAEAIHQTLLGAPGKRLKAESLISRLRPGLPATRETPVVTTLNELRAVGAVVERDEALTIRDDVPGGLEPGGMRRVVLQSIIEDASSRDFWEDEEGEVGLLGGIDVARSLTWFLTLSVKDAPWSWDGPHAIGQKQSDELPIKVIRNPTRWNQFLRWAPYLGFAFPFGANALIPDPSIAVRPVMAELLRGKGPQSVEAVVRALGERLPMLDTGSWRAQLAERHLANSDGDISSSLSFALIRLRREGLIALDEGLGDAGKVTFADEAGAYHAIRWVGGVIR